MKKTLISIVLFSLALACCEPPSNKPNTKVDQDEWICPKDPVTQDRMVSFNLSCYAAMTGKDYSPSNIAAVCMKQAAAIYCRKASEVSQQGM
jgi:hypothetical protein